MKKLFKGKGLGKVIAILMAVALISAFVPMALADWEEDPDSIEVRVIRENGETTWAEIEGLVYVRTETEQGDPIYGEPEITGYVQIPVYADGSEIIGYENGDPIYGEAPIIGYEKKNAERGVTERTDITDSGNSGAYTGTPGNGQKFGSDKLTQSQKSIGITVSGGSNPTIFVPAGYTVTVRVQKSNVYSYVDVTGSMTYQTNGNNAWIHDVQEAKIDDLEKPIYGEVPITGYVQIPVYADGSEILYYENGDPIYGEAPIEGYEVITTDIYKTLIWVEEKEENPQPPAPPIQETQTITTTTTETEEETELDIEEVELEDEPAILAAFEAPEEEIETEIEFEETVPLADMAPQTGDFATMTIAAVVALIALSGIVLVITTTKKQEN